jgi:tRNA G18 (ribose-2'-O)-methylase SpoU
LACLHYFLPCGKYKAASPKGEKRFCAYFCKKTNPNLDMHKRSMEELNRKTVHTFRQADKVPIVLVLDNIRSMHNVGSVFRTADAFLVHSMWLCGYTPRPPHRDIHKTALGATETVAWKQVDRAVHALQQLKQEGYLIYGVEQAQGSILLQQFRFQENEKLALVFGNEVSGVGEEALSWCDGCLEIPQLGMKHSLNISVAAGIVLWELVRARPQLQQ